MSKNTGDQLPDVKLYTTVSAYMRDVYEYKVSKDSRFNLEIWSLELGFKSRSFMYMVYHEKRLITESVAKILSKYLKHDESQKNHFMKLVLLQRAKTEEERDIIREAIQQTVYVGEDIVSEDNLAVFLGSSLHPIIQLLLAYDDMQGSAEELAQVLKTDVKTIETALAALERIDVIGLKPGATNPPCWESKSKAFNVKGDNKAQGERLKEVDAFHLRTQHEVIDVIKKGDNDVLKKIISIYLPASKTAQNELIEDIDAFINKLKVKYSTVKFNQKQMLKLNLNVYAVTDVFDAKSSQKSDE